MHGGSGLDKEVLVKAIKTGICKININTKKIREFRGNNIIEEIEGIKKQFIDKDHVVYIPGLDTVSDITLPHQEQKNVCYYMVDQPFSKDGLSFFDAAAPIVSKETIDFDKVTIKGHEILGWYLDEEMTKPVEGKYTFTKKTTFYKLLKDE